MTFFDCPNCGKPVQISFVAADKKPAKQAPLEGIEIALADYTDYIVYTKDGVKMDRYIRGDEGRKIWGAINDIVKQYGGKWFSSGANSYWKLPK